jgi:phenylacetate-CoA ligase
MNRYELSVISPCYNERENVIALVDRLQKMFVKKRINGEIVLINDASTDDTGSFIERMAFAYPNVIGVHHKTNQGIVAGWKSGLRHASGTFVNLIDADMQCLPEDVGRLYEEIQFSKFDIVQGSRNYVKNFNGARPFLSRGLNAVLNFAFKMQSFDNKSSFLICRKEVLEDILSPRFRYKQFQTLLGAAAKSKHYSIKNIETLFEERKLGKSFIPRFPVRMVYETLHDVAKGFVEFRLFDVYEMSLRNYLKEHPPVKEDVPLAGWRKWYFELYRLLFPVHHWVISYNAVEYYRDLKRSQWLPPDAIREYQEKRLRKLLAHAYHKVAFYREAFDARGLKPEDIQTLEDLLKLPTITKALIRENLHLGLMSVDYDKSKVLRITTSGSTGEPLVVYVEKKQLELRWAATIRSLEWTGYRFGDRQIRLWHKYLGMKGLEIVKEILDAKMSRRKFIPAYEIDDAGLESFVQGLMAYKPVVLDGYAESYNLIARYLHSHRYEGRRPKGIMSSGQSMPLKSRKTIEEGFGCKVFDKYGCREFAGGTAYQCETGEGYHIVAEGTIIEIVKEGRHALPGEVGEIVLTDLNNYAMPLIRYAIGDLAVAMDNSVPCRCGRGLPRIGQVYGRVQSIIFGTQNQMIPGTFFARLFADFDYGVKQFQVVQEQFGGITIKIVKANLFSDSILDYIKKQIRKHMGEDLNISFEFVDEISLGQTGKRQHSVSFLDVAGVSNEFNTQMIYDDAH